MSIIARAHPPIAPRVPAREITILFLIALHTLDGARVRLIRVWRTNSSRVGKSYVRVRLDERDGRRARSSVCAQSKREDDAIFPSLTHRIICAYAHEEIEVSRVNRVLLLFERYHEFAGEKREKETSGTKYTALCRNSPKPK